MRIEESIIDNGFHEVTIKTVRTYTTEEALRVFKQIVSESKYLYSDFKVAMSMEAGDMSKLLAEGCFSDNKWLIGAYVNNVCVGGVMLTRDDNKLKSHRGTVHIALLKDYQEKGIGRLLLSKAIHVAKDANIQYIEANVITANVQAVRLFSNFDFHKEAYITNDILKDHQYYDTYLMIKNLNEEVYHD